MDEASALAMGLAIDVSLILELLAGIKSAEQTPASSNSAPQTSTTRTFLSSAGKVHLSELEKAIKTAHKALKQHNSDSCFFRFLKAHRLSSDLSQAQDDLETARTHFVQAFTVGAALARPVQTAVAELQARPEPGNGLLRLKGRVKGKRTGRQTSMTYVGAEERQVGDWRTSPPNAREIEEAGHKCMAVRLDNQEVCGRDATRGFLVFKKEYCEEPVVLTGDSKVWVVWVCGDHGKTEGSSFLNINMGEAAQFWAPPAS